MALGFPGKFGEMIANQLGSPKAIDRMAAYLDYEKPDDIQIIVDEMLAIRSEIDAWREKKASEEANARYNEILNYGLEDLWQIQDEGQKPDTDIDESLYDYFYRKMDVGELIEYVAETEGRLIAPACIQDGNQSL